MLDSCCVILVADSCSLDACCDHYSLPFCSGAETAAPAPARARETRLSRDNSLSMSTLSLGAVSGRALSAWRPSAVAWPSRALTTRAGARHTIHGSTPINRPRLNLTHRDAPLETRCRPRDTRGRADRRRHLTTREPVQALGLTRLSSRSSEPRLRVFCVPPLRIFQKRRVSSAAAETTVVPSGL